MKLSGLHLLLTFQCTRECDHCFVWGSPWQKGTMTLATVRTVLAEACTVDGLEWIFFEGGEPFLFHGLLAESVRLAAEAGFRIGIVTNAYWATDIEDAVLCLRPLAGRIQDLTLSSDLYHGAEGRSPEVRNALAAAEHLEIPAQVVAVAQPEALNTSRVTGQRQVGLCDIMYRGRAAEKLTDRATRNRWDLFDRCPHENLREPGRLHVDCLGNLHLCQGIVIGNLLDRPLRDICATFRPEEHPIAGPLLTGGPAELARRYEFKHGDRYADACHLCSHTCAGLRSRFPAELRPDQMFGSAEH